MAQKLRLTDQPDLQAQLTATEAEVQRYRDDLLSLLTPYGATAAEGFDRLVRAVEKRCAARLRATSFSVHEDDGVDAAADLIDPDKEN